MYPVISEMAPDEISNPLIVSSVAPVYVEVVATAPVVPLTVKLEVSTAIPPSKLTNVEKVQPPVIVSAWSDLVIFELV